MKAILYDWGGANVWLFHLINNIRGEHWDRLMLAGTALGDHRNFTVYLTFATLSGLWTTGRTAFDIQARRGVVWLSVLAVFAVAYLADGALIGWLKPLLDFPRPPLALPPGSLHVIGVPEYHRSLPSGHASFAMLTAASLWPVLGREKRILAAIFVCWVGVSRVSLGVHFPADVAAGFVSSLLIVLLVRWLIAIMVRVAGR